MGTTTGERDVRRQTQRRRRLARIQQRVRSGRYLLDADATARALLEALRRRSRPD
jgi:anti-sigma28 factor (negative regulator of flagellin synthesis)